jgi:hypothetical protein
MIFIHKSIINIIKHKYEILTKDYILPGALYFVEPYDSFILNYKNQFFVALENKNKNICFNILNEIQKYIEQQIKKKNNIDFYMKKIRIINFIKILLRLI